MAGFSNDTVYATNVNFEGGKSPTISTNGQLIIGSTALNGGGTHLNIGQITSTTLTVGYSSPNITIEAAGMLPTTFIEDSGVAVPVANILNIFGTNGISTTGAANTVTVTSANGQIATKFAVQTGTSPVVPTAAGIVTINGSTVAAGTNPIRTNGTGANTLAVQVQIAQAIAATDATKIGLANFDSAKFTVDANGFVSTSGTGIGNTITGDSGGALSPTAGNWNILGRSGSKTSGSGSTLTVNSPPFSQVGSSSTSVLNSGEFVTAAVTRTLPATAGLVDGDLVIYFCTTAGALVITANTGQTIRVGTLVSSSAGTCTSTAIGDSITLRFDATAVSWRAVSVIGTWIMA